MANPKSHSITSAGPSSEEGTTGPSIAIKSKPVTSSFYPIEVSVEHTMPQRAAEYLHLAAEKWPFQLIRYDEIYRNILMLKKRGAVSEVDIKRTRTWVRSAQRWLAQYGRHVVLGELGARGSVDDQDIIESVAPRKASRVQSAIKSAHEMDALVDTRKISGDMGTWYKKAFKPSLGTLEKVRESLVEGAPEAKALPPKR